MPQVLENRRLKSVDGLALPFLASWMLGDLTNLLGVRTVCSRVLCL